MARSMCRKAERRVVSLVNERSADPAVSVFLNRLSDFFFVAARYAAMREGKAEVAYKKGFGTKDTRQ